MDTSVFTDLTKKPDNEDLKMAIWKQYDVWMKIRDFVFQKYPAAVEEWHVSVKKYGWGFRIKDKKRAIIYLSPRKNYFLVTMVFGQKASDRILESPVAEQIKTELIHSRVYMEGRVIRLEISDDLLLQDIFKLIEIKIAH